MRLFFDSEFLEDGQAQTVKLLSIGIVADNGAALYLVVTDAPRHEANEFVREHVLPHLDLPPGRSPALAMAPGETGIRSVGATSYVRCPRADAGTIILNWVAALTDKPEWWAWYGSYDWVVLCQLFGNMTDLPNGWPMFVRDLRQIATGFPADYGLDTPPVDLPVHHALADAFLLRARHRWVASQIPLRQ